MKTRAVLISVPILALLAAVAIAQTNDHAGHGADNTSTEGMGPAAAAYAAANADMHSNMDITYTNDPDVDFALGMIPHHEGAVAMARILLEHGDDPELQALAEEIIAAQETEIAWMKDWLVRNGHMPAS